MSKSEHYPPSYLRYQIEHSPVTVHLNKKLKEALDAFRGGRSYSQAILELIEGKLNVEMVIKRAPVTELIIKYTNGFAEAMNRYGIGGRCKKCGKEYRYLWNNHIILIEVEEGVDSILEKVINDIRHHYLLDSNSHWNALHMLESKEAVYEDSPTRLYYGSLIYGTQRLFFDIASPYRAISSTKYGTLRYDEDSEIKIYEDYFKLTAYLLSDTVEGTTYVMEPRLNYAIRKYPSLASQYFTYENNQSHT